MTRKEEGFTVLEVIVLMIFQLVAGVIWLLGRLGVWMFRVLKSWQAGLFTEGETHEQ